MLVEPAATPTATELLKPPATAPRKANARRPGGAAAADADGAPNNLSGAGNVDKPTLGPQSRLPVRRPARPRTNA